ncbi:chaperone SurA [Litorimonas cladophorae]|uniref:Parvulin-like PPIase n=1 Tax=Litorimonas cladophorae TaxID=1220491 RepID=A0A918NC55_9PROT|nr:peptidylprolyl isomerase [Litorimonas cladophorae]GGX61626.1 chaperone SurA [Litorimonas cladophorae]
MRLLKTTAISAALLATTLFVSTPAYSQSAPHGIAAVVNSDIVTIHDLRQRVLFMMATTGAEADEASIQRLQRQALRNLVDEHLQMQEAEKYEQSISDEEVNGNVGRLLSRNGADPNELVSSLAAAGVSIETLRDQVRSEIAWQRIVNGLYGSRIRISDAQIDETLNQITANASKPNYRVAEIYIEATADIGGMDGAMEGANAMIAQVKSGAPFPLLAQQFSSAASSAKGGDVGWVREGELRPEIDTVIRQMDPGSVSQPIQVPGGVYVVALVDKKISEADTLYKLKQVTVEAETDVAKARLIALRGELSGCETLEADVSSLDDVSSTDMGELKSSDLNESIVTALEKTDVGSLSDPIERPTGATSIMVCKRETTGTDIPTRDQIEDRLLDQQLAQASKRALRDLRRQATLVVR